MLCFSCGQIVRLREKGNQIGIFGGWAALKKRWTFSNPPSWVYDWAGASTSAGVSVSETTSYNLSAVWNAVRAISGDIASLPLILYRRTADGGRERAIDHQLYSLLHESPNGYLTSFQFIECMMVALLMRGNFYALLNRDGMGNVMSMHILGEGAVRSTNIELNGKINSYTIQTSSGLQTFLADEILHVRGLSNDGIQGRGVLDYARESLGLSLAEQQYQSYYFGNNASPPGFIIVPGRANEGTLAALRKSWDDMYRGVKASGKPGILWEGMSYQSQKNSPSDAQLLELRKFSTLEIARWFCIPPIKIQSNEGSVSYSSSEVQNRQYYDNCLRPWLARIETELRLKLLRPSEKPNYYIEFIPAALLRADTIARSQAYQIGIQSGYLRINEVRAMENLTPVEGGDVNLVPLNYTTLERMAAGDTDSADDTPDAQPEPINDGPAGDEPSVDEGAITRGIEERSAKSRQVFAKAWRCMFADAAGRIITREVKDIREAMKRIKPLDGDFRVWVDEYYGREGYIANIYSTPIATAIEAIGGDLIEEHGLTDRDIEGYAKEYASFRAEMHKADSRGELIGDGMDIDAGRIEAVLMSWEQDRKWEIADTLSVHIEPACRMYLEV